MSKEIKNISNRVERSYEGKCYAFWRGRIVYEHQKTRVRRFKNAKLGNILLSATPLANSPRFLMSALPPKADIRSAKTNVRFVPIADI